MISPEFATQQLRAEAVQLAKKHTGEAVHAVVVGDGEIAVLTATLHLVLGYGHDVVRDEGGVAAPGGGGWSLYVKAERPRGLLSRFVGALWPFGRPTQ